jgi:hypothetical protein
VPLLPGHNDSRALRAAPGGVAPVHHAGRVAEALSGGFLVRCARMRHVTRFVAWLQGLPMLARWASVGAIAFGVSGGIAGLVVGLFVYAPTAPFAAVELGFPAVFVGAVAGLVAGMLMKIARRIRRREARSL